MLDLYLRLKRRRRTACRWITGVLGITAAILVAPKDMRHAADSRFLLVVALGLVVTLGLAGTVRALARYRESRLALRYVGAPRPLTAAVRYLLDERAGAGRYTLPALAIGLTSAFLLLACRWPQAVLLAPLAPCFTVTFFGALAAMIGLPFWHRTNWINYLFLRRYLAQMSRYAGFRPLTPRRAKRKIDALFGPALIKKRDGVQAGGFDWRWSDWTKNTLILGQPGSGKTNALGSVILESLFLNFQGSGLKLGGLLQDVKGDYRARIERLCEVYARSDDLRIFDLSADAREAGSPFAVIINPIAADDTPIEVAASLWACAETLGQKTQDSYFPLAAQDWIAKYVTLLRAGLPGGEAPTVVHLYQLANEREKKPEVTPEGGIIPSDEPPTLFQMLCWTIDERWPDKSKLPIAVVDELNARALEHDKMPERQRAGIVGTLNQLIAVLTSEPLRHFVVGTSTVTCQQCVDENLILHIDAPLAEGSRQAMVVNTFVKAAYQNAVRRRLRKLNPTFYFCDEFHNLFSPGPTGDSQFFSLSRESNHANIIAFQNLPLLYQRTRNRHEADSLTSNCATKIMLRNTDPDTNEMASRLFGEMTSITVSPSEAAHLGEVFRRPRTTYARSTATSRVVPPETFAGLAVPDPDAEIPYTQSIVHLGTRARTERLDLLWKVHIP